MTSRKRFTLALNHKEADRVPIHDSPWGHTINRWHSEGLPEDESPASFFGYEMTGQGADCSFQLPHQVIEETETYTIYKDANGATRRSFKDHESTPECIDFTIKDRKTWEKYKPKLAWNDSRVDWENGLKANKTAREKELLLITRLLENQQLLLIWLMRPLKKSLKQITFIMLIFVVIFYGCHRKKQVKPYEGIEADYVNKIVFTSGMGANSEIYVMTPDGSDKRRLTFNSYNDETSVWSPDGQKIAFTSTRHGNREIYTMFPDGTGVKRLTFNETCDSSIRWSSDSKMIVFTSTIKGNSEIYVINADGTGLTRLSETPEHAESIYQICDITPEWSPDSKTIVYESNMTGGGDIYLVNVDGKGRKIIEDWRTGDGYPVWSPDGKLIAYESTKTGNGDIYIMKPDGSDKRRLTESSGRDSAPIWSPDGKKIIFESNRNGGSDIYVINVDGTGLKLLTNVNSYDVEPVWSPDGQRIAFMSSGTKSFDLKSFDIYTVNIDGTEMNNLTDNDVYDADPDWSPFIKMTR